MLKVSTYVEFSKNIEVSISAEDIESCFITSPIDESLSASLSLLNDCAKVLKGIPDSLVAEMSPKQHEIIRGFLLKSADRFIKTEDGAQNTKEGPEQHTTGQGMPAGLA